MIGNFKALPPFSYLFNRNAFICMVRHSCSQTTSAICSCAHKQWIYCSIAYACQNKLKRTKIHIISIIKEDSHYTDRVSQKTPKTIENVLLLEFQCVALN